MIYISVQSVNTVAFAQANCANNLPHLKQYTFKTMTHLENAIVEKHVRERCSLSNQHRGSRVVSESIVLCLKGKAMRLPVIGECSDHTGRLARDDLCDTLLQFLPYVQRQ